MQYKTNPAPYLTYGKTGPYVDYIFGQLSGVSCADRMLHRHTSAGASLMGSGFWERLRNAGWCCCH